MRTVESVGATTAICSITDAICGLVPMIPCGISLSYFSRKVVNMMSYAPVASGIDRQLNRLEQGFPAHRLTQKVHRPTIDCSLSRSIVGMGGNKNDWDAALLSIQ